MRHEIKEKDPESSLPQSHERRPVNISRGHKFPNSTPPVLPRKFSRCSTKNLPSSFTSSSPSCSLGPESQSSGTREGRGGENVADASILLSGVTVTAGPSKRGLEVGVQDGFSIWRLNVIGSFLKFQQHGHQGVRVQRTWGAIFDCPILGR